MQGSDTKSSGLISAQRLQDKHFKSKKDFNDHASGSRSPKRDTNNKRPNRQAETIETSAERIKRVTNRAKKELNSLFEDEDSEPESPRNPK